MLHDIWDTGVLWKGVAHGLAHEGTEVLLKDGECRGDHVRLRFVGGPTQTPAYVGLV